LVIICHWLSLVVIGCKMQQRVTIE